MAVPCTKPFLCMEQSNGTGWRPATGKQRKVQSTIPIVTSTKTTPGETKKAKRSINVFKRSHLEAIRVDWQREVNRSLVDSKLQYQSSLDRRTRPKSKSGSGALPQKTLEDGGSIKLSILDGERTSWLSTFTLRQTSMRVHMEWKWSS